MKAPDDVRVLAKHQGYLVAGGKGTSSNGAVTVWDPKMNTYYLVLTIFLVLSKNSIEVKISSRSTVLLVVYTGVLVLIMYAMPATTLLPSVN